VIIFITLPEKKGEGGGPEAIPLELLPRQCPVCHFASILGHGRRLRAAHDQWREQIWVRRGRCCRCRKTFTVLPTWLVPSGHYSVPCRQQACERIAGGIPAEQAVPECQSATRSPDPTTVRRWAQRRVLSVWCGFTVLRSWFFHFWHAPTIFAWDLAAFCRMLPFEARSP